MTSSHRLNRLSIAVLCGLAALAGCSSEQTEDLAAPAETGASKQALTVTTGEFLRDIHTRTNIVLDQAPKELIVVNGTLYFVSYDSSSGYEIWKSDGTAAGTTLLADIAPGVGTSWPRNLTAVGDKLYFTADIDEVGVELYVSDGTAAGTRLVTDLNPGTADFIPNDSTIPLNRAALGGKLYFAGNHPVHGVELWRTDGTSAGTELVADINPSGNGSPTNFAVIGNVLYFAANDGTSGNELWRTDGTAAGTWMVKDINPGTKDSSPSGMIALGDKIYFSATDGVTGFELWVTDGSQGNATRLGDFVPGNNTSVSTGPQHFFAYNDLLIFTQESSSYLWRTDGTPAGTFKLGDFRKPSLTPVQYALFNGLVYFTAFSPLYGTEIFKTDGTVEGTDIGGEVNVSSTSSDPTSLAVLGDHLYFSGGNFQTPERAELFRLDGTSDVAELVADINPGNAASEPAELTVVGNTLFFAATNSAVGTELFKSDGTTAGTVLVKDVYVNNTQHALPSNFAALGDKTLFISSDETAATGQKEPWVTDGTDAGTELLADIYPSASNGSSPSPYVVLDGVAYFAASGSGTNSEPGRELWRTDGTPAGTFQVANIMPNGSSMETNPHMIAFGDRLYFAATDGIDGRELYFSDGSEGGTLLFKDINPGSASGSPTLLKVHGQRFFFSAVSDAGRELWVSDGTDTGTMMVANINPDAGNSNPANFTSLGSKLVFTATDGSTGVELWVTDGTEAGTVQLADINPTSIGTTSGSSISGYAVVENRMFFAAYDGTEAKIWITDGTPGGTMPLKGPRAAAPADSISSVTAAGNRIYFVADDGIAGKELWTSDGTEEGTRLVKDIRPGPLGSSISQLTTIGSRVVFSANDGKHGAELWLSDGTAEGTHLLVDVMPGARGSSPATFTAIGGSVFFSADDGIVGLEPWVTDGTVEGTRRVADLNPGALPSAPEFFFRNGSKVYVVAMHPLHGRELAVLHLSDEKPTIICPDDITRSAPGTGKATVNFAATATDDGSAPPIVTYSVEPGSEFDVGLTSVVATATDDAGQTASCSFNVRVVLGDQLPPTLLCPANVTAVVNGKTGGEVSYAPAVASDDSGLDPVISYSHASGALFPIGATEVTVTAKDASNNTATCKFTVTVTAASDDAPEVLCPPDVSAAAISAGGIEVTYPAAAAFDEDGSDLGISYSAASGSFFPVGETVITASATDDAGNTGTCSFKVTVTPPPPAAETGCGCGAAGGEPATGALALVLAFGFAAIRRRGATARG